VLLLVLLLLLLCLLLNSTQEFNQNTIRYNHQPLENCLYGEGTPSPQLIIELASMPLDSAQKLKHQGLPFDRPRPLTPAANPSNSSHHRIESPLIARKNHEE
jgi:hypothetical protein